MADLEIKPYLRYIAIKIGAFSSEIVDERNFGYDEAFSMKQFEKEYSHDGCIVVKVEI